MIYNKCPCCGYDFTNDKLHKKITVVSGYSKTESFTFGSPIKYDRVTLSEENVTDIISVTDGDGNTAFNTGYLADGTTPYANTLNNWVAKGQYFIGNSTVNVTREVGTKIELPISDVFNIVKIIDSGSTDIDVTTAMMSVVANNITTA